MWVGICVVVDIGDDFSARRPESGIARGGETAIFGRDYPVTVGMRDLFSGIRRAVIHYEDFVVGIVEPQQALQTLRKSAAPVKSTHDDRNLRPAKFSRERNFAERFPDAFES